MKSKIIIVCFIIFIFLTIGILTSPLVFFLNGSSEVVLNVGQDYKEKGAKALFNLFRIKIEGKVDSNKVGTYKIKYYYFYSHITRTVKVIDKVSPTITLNGNIEFNLAINGEYNEPGFKAIDNYDKDITDKVIVDNKIDLTKPGTYEITYSVKDSSGNETSVTRKIFVNEKGPLSMNLKEFSLDGYFDSTILKETPKAGDSYIDETVFYGDSITYNFAYYKNLPWKVIWAKSSVTPENAHTWTVPINPYGVDMTLIDALEKYKPKRLVITLGANAVATMTESYFISTYEKLIEKIKENSPSTLIIVQSIFPVDSKWDTYTNTNRTINNTSINRLNYLLAQMCERQKIKFLNSATVLKDENGQCKKGYCYYTDGIHLMPEGNKRVVEYIKTHAYIEGE